MSYQRTLHYPLYIYKLITRKYIVDRNFLKI